MSNFVVQQERQNLQQNIIQALDNKKGLEQPIFQQLIFQSTTMGNQLQKQYNIKSKPLKLPGSYSFLRFTYHPITSQSIFIIKSPHKGTIIKQSTVILPITQVKNFSSSNDSFAICPKSIPLSLLQPNNQIQMKIIMYKILKLSSEIGRCFWSNGRIMIWCEEKRCLSSMAPEELRHDKRSQKSSVFISGICLLNFLACVHQYDKIMAPINKKQEKKKEKQSKTKKSTSNKTLPHISKNQINKSTNYNNKSQPFICSPQNLPAQIKLFFDPKDTNQYFNILQTLTSKLQTTKFWSSISQGLRQLITNMLSLDPTTRVDLQTILKIPYFQSSLQVRLYFLLADQIQIMEIKQAVTFMKVLELIIKQGTVFENDILERYIVPVLVSIANNTGGDSKNRGGNNYVNKSNLSSTNNSKQTITFNQIQPNKKPFSPSQSLASHAVSILLQVTKPPLDIIFLAFKKSPSTNQNMFLLALQKKQKLYYLFQQQKFDIIISRMLFCWVITIQSTPFVMSCIKEEKYKKEIEFKVMAKVLKLQFDGGKDLNIEKIFINGLKCAIELIKHKWTVSLKQYIQIQFNPLKLSLQANIHLLYLYNLFIEHLPTKHLITVMTPKLNPFLSQTSQLISDQLFMTAHKLYQNILDRLYKNRKLNYQDEINLQYSQEYFKLKDQKNGEGKVLEEEVKKMKIYIEKNGQEFKNIEWLAKEILM